jgi:hypothetical protein
MAAWYLPSSVCGFSTRSAKKPHTNKRKYRSAEGKNADRVRPEIKKLTNMQPRPMIVPQYKQLFT